MDLDDMAFRLAKLGTHLPRGGGRLARHLAKLRPELTRYEIRTRYGPVVCDLSEPSCYPLLKDGEYSHWREDEETLSSLKLDQSSIVLDVGANMGILTRMFAARCGTLHAFEPSPRALRLLRANAADLSNVTIHPVAVADKEGVVRFTERESTDLSSIGEDGIEVAAVTVDSLQLTPTLIKIDVEGYEHLVLKGATKTLSKGPILIFEAHHEISRQYCEDIILSANPHYKIRRMGKGYNYLASVE